MLRSRWAVALILVGLIGPPLVLPALGLIGLGDWPGWRHTDRLARLVISSLSLAGGTVLVTLPIATVVAALLYKSDLPGRRFFRRLVVFGLFVPLPILATAWQSALGGGIAIFTADPGRPWPSGFSVAILLHAAAALPWVILLVGQGLTWVEPELEDDALLSASPGVVLRSVVLPRAAPAIFAAVLWVGVQTTTEITVTDITLVRTYAEEVYTQLVLPEDVAEETSAGAAARRAAAIAVPPMLLLAAIVVLGVRALDRRVPELRSPASDRPLIRLGSFRAPAAIAVAAAIASALAIPVSTLVWRVGLSGSPPRWSIHAALATVALTVRAHGHVVLSSVAVAMAAGIIATAVALVAAWQASNSRWFQALIVVGAALCWAAPGPVIGIGLRQAFDMLMDAEDLWGGSAFRLALYDSPSLLPVLWADFVRLWPFALALVWPAVRAIPRDLVEAVRIDGGSPWSELRHAVWPLCRSAVFRSIVAVGVLALGELSASKIAATVSGQTLAHDVFTQMHYGVTSTLAAQCLILLAIIAPVILLPARRDHASAIDTDV